MYEPDDEKKIRAVDHLAEEGEMGIDKGLVKAITELLELKLKSKLNLIP